MNLTKLNIVYIYSFLPVCGKLTYDKIVKERFINTPIAKKANNGFKPDESGSWINRTGLSSYLSMNLNTGFDIDYEFEGFLCSDPTLKLTIQPLFRFYSFGASLTFHVTCCRNNSTVSEKDAYKLLQIISTEGNRKAKETFSINNNSELGSANEYTLYELFKNRLKKKLDLVNENNSQKIELLCIKEEIIEDTVKFEASVPWVITSLETQDSEVLEAFCYSDTKIPRSQSTSVKQNKICRFEESIAPLLYRAVDDNFESYKIEPSYDTFSSESKYNGLNNMYIDSRLYIHLSRRSILTICNDFKANPAKYVFPTLIDINEINHTRWQALIVLNMILDKYIAQFSNHEADNNYNTEEKLRIILMLLKKVLANLENPSSYVISGDSLREISENISDTYKIEDLINHALKKVELLEKVYLLDLEIDFLKG